MAGTVQAMTSMLGCVSRLVVSVAVLAVASTGVAAQVRGIGTPPPADKQRGIIALASSRLLTGEASFARGDLERARAEFDDAVDAFLDSGYDLRSDSGLMAAYRETVEKVNRYTTIGVNAEGDSVWPLQAYEATSDDFRLEDLPTSDDLALGGDVVDAKFLVRVEELQSRFQKKFGRAFTLTGRDTPVHSRLYGHGRAVDVRVHDLTSAHVQFIVQNGRALRMRVLDFSSAQRVASHNLKVITSGRPLDTLSTGVHLHLNDTPRAKQDFVERPASKSTPSLSKSRKRAGTTVNR